ncbi:hypothetical protein ACFPOE_19355 [Caenimonas terrae]|uniref:Uncharacterized protein n=1 Tax=Caenimonas terrae TaxID=696074 RepID=A0ABW0NH49_9BURK
MSQLVSSLPASEQPSHPAPHRERVSALSALLGLLLAPLAWFLQLSLNVALASQACFPKDMPLDAPVMRGLLPLAAGAEVAALVLAAVGGWLAWRNWQRTSGERPGPVHHLIESGDGRTRFLALSGMMTSGLFLLAVLFDAVALSAAPVCGG